MASTTYTQHYADGTRKLVRRIAKQGRKSSGLSKPELFRLYTADKEKLASIEEKMGHLFNKNQIVRDAVHIALESIYTELVKT